MYAAKPIPQASHPDRTNLVAKALRDSGKPLLRFIRARVAGESDAED